MRHNFSLPLLDPKVAIVRDCCLVECTLTNVRFLASAIENEAHFQRNVRIAQVVDHSMKEHYRHSVGAECHVGMRYGGGLEWGCRGVQFGQVGVCSLRSPIRMLSHRRLALPGIAY